LFKQRYDPLLPYINLKLHQLYGETETPQVIRQVKN
jgi:hypothetical protein